MLPVVTDKPNARTTLTASIRPSMVSPTLTVKAELPAQKRLENAARLRKLLKEGASRQGVKFQRSPSSAVESDAQRAAAAAAALGRDSQRFAELLQQLAEEHEAALAGVMQENLRLVEDMQRLKELLEPGRALEAVAEKNGTAADDEDASKQVSGDDLQKCLANVSSLALQVEEKRQALEDSVPEEGGEAEERSQLPDGLELRHRSMPQFVASPASEASTTSTCEREEGLDQVGHIASVASCDVDACASLMPSRRQTMADEALPSTEVAGLEILGRLSTLEESHRSLDLKFAADQDNDGIKGCRPSLQQGRPVNVQSLPMTKCRSLGDVPQSSPDEDLGMGQVLSSTSMPMGNGIVNRTQTSAVKRQSNAYALDEFLLLDVWQDQHRSVTPTRRAKGSRCGTTRISSSAMDAHIIPDAWIHWSDRLITRPCSGKRVCWDVLGCFLICYDLVVIPLQTFKIKETTFTSTMLWVATIFWTLDIAFTFLTGFNSDGLVITHPVRIAKRYAKTWLCFDISLITVDWSLCLAKALDVSISGSTGDTAASIIVTLGRCLRIVRLLKLLKIYNGTLSDLLEHVQSELFVITLNMGKLVIMIMLLNHVIACFWYSIGSWDATKEDSWVHVNRLQERSFGYKYFTALHWSLTQFTPASMEVVPQNEGERMYTICVMVFAMVTFSSFISSITNAMTQLRSINKEKMQTEAQLRRYLGENKVSVALMGRVWGCLHKAWRRQKNRVHWKDLEVLPMLPSGLKSDLQDEVYGPVLAVHPFFLLLVEMYPEQSRRLYQQGLDEYSVAVGHEVFSFSDQASEMYWTLTGTLQYYKDQQQDSLMVHMAPACVQAGVWVCEPVLWVKWKHVGQLVANTRAELVSLKATSLHEVLEENIHSRKYALKFWTYFKDHAEIVSDLFIDDEVIEELVIDASSEAEDSISATDFCSGHPMSNRDTISSQHGLFAALRNRRSSFAFGLGAPKEQMSQVRRKSLTTRKSWHRDGDEMPQLMKKRTQSVLGKIRASEHQSSANTRESRMTLFSSFFTKGSENTTTARVSNMLGKSRNASGGRGKSVRGRKNSRDSNGSARSRKNSSTSRDGDERKRPSLASAVSIGTAFSNESQDE